MNSRKYNKTLEKLPFTEINFLSLPKNKPIIHLNNYNYGK